MKMISFQMLAKVVDCHAHYCSVRIRNCVANEIDAFSFMCYVSIFCLLASLFPETFMERSYLEPYGRGRDPL
jgi:hypothetical protein